MDAAGVPKKALLVVAGAAVVAGVTKPPPPAALAGFPKRPLPPPLPRAEPAPAPAAVLAGAPKRPPLGLEVGTADVGAEASGAALASTPSPPNAPVLAPLLLVTAGTAAGVPKSSPSPSMAKPKPARPSSSSSFSLLPLPLPSPAPLPPNSDLLAGEAMLEARTGDAAVAVVVAVVVAGRPPLLAAGVPNGAASCGAAADLPADPPAAAVVVLVLGVDVDVVAGFPPKRLPPGAVPNIPALFPKRPLLLAEAVGCPGCLPNMLLPAVLLPAAPLPNKLAPPDGAVVAVPLPNKPAPPDGAVVAVPLPNKLAPPDGALVASTLPVPRRCPALPPNSDDGAPFAGAAPAAVVLVVGVVIHAGALL